MPIFEFGCDHCGHYEEKLMSYKKSIENRGCPSCQNKLRKLPSLIAKTKEAWNAQWNDGLSGSGSYDAGLGMTIYSEKQRTQELNKRGWVRESDLGGESWWDKETSKRKVQVEKDKENFNNFQSNLKKFDGDKEKALIETYPAKDCLAGKFDRVD